MNKSKSLSIILEECLDQVTSGKETLSAVLAQHPELEDQLRPELEAAIWLQKQREIIGIRPGYTPVSRQRLINQIKQVEQNPSRINIPIFGWYRKAAGLALAAMLLVVAMFAYLGGSQAVKDSRPGDKLYDVKLTAEDMQLAKAPNAAAEASMQIEFADRRVDEAKSLIEEGRFEDAEIALNAYRKHIMIASDLIQELQEDSQDKVKLAQNLATAVTDHNETFSSFVTIVDLPTNMVVILSSTVAFNDQISQAMIILMDEYEETLFPVPATAIPPALKTLSPSPTATLIIELFNLPEPSEVLEISETPEPINPVDDDDYDGNNEELIPTKTLKDNDNNRNKDKDNDNNRNKDKDLGTDRVKDKK